MHTNASGPGHVTLNDIFYVDDGTYRLKGDTVKGVLSKGAETAEEVGAAMATVQQTAQARLP